MADVAGSDPRLPHRRSGSPDDLVGLDCLTRLGVLYWRIEDPSQFETPGTLAHEQLERICHDRKYQNRDQVILAPDRTPDYEAKIRMFFDEHLHEDEEIRFIVDGRGYFDIRDESVRYL